METIDPNGNVIEEKFFGPRGKLEYNYLYKYVVDAKGNWTTRHWSEKKILKGKSVIKLEMIHFRTIAYYE